MKKYLTVWLLFAKNTFDKQSFIRGTWAIFLIAKVFRFAIFTLFIVVLVNKTTALAGYNLNQTILFFLSFNLVDILAQMLFRDVYRFRPQVVNGTFDFFLTKPLNSLFRALFGGPDILDFFTLIPLLYAIFYFINILGVGDLYHVSIYLGLIGASFLISLAFHILVLSLAVITTEIDHAIMLYRDITSMGRFPIEIFREPIRGFLTFALPVGIMMSFPVKALLGLLSPILIIYALVFSIIFFWISLKVWGFSLKHYSSASS